MPTAILLAGPNGAGKTTFASQYLADGAQGFAFLNPDEIARGLGTSLTPAERDLNAGRLLLQRLDALVERRTDFVLETTLSGALYARRIPHWKAAGYRVALIYLRLPDADASIRRVAQRVGAAMALYRGRFILVVEDGVPLPSNLQGLYESRYSGSAIEFQAGMKILKALRGLKAQ